MVKFVEEKTFRRQTEKGREQYKILLAPHFVLLETDSILG